MECLLEQSIFVEGAPATQHPVIARLAVEGRVGSWDRSLLPLVPNLGNGCERGWASGLLIPPLSQLSLSPATVQFTI